MNKWWVLDYVEGIRDLQDKGVDKLRDHELATLRRLTQDVIEELGVTLDDIRYEKVLREKRKC